LSIIFSSSSTPKISHKQVQINVNANPNDQNVAERLKRKEMELKAREEEINKKEQQLKQEEALGGKGEIKNWPKCYPLIYQDINKEIPDDQKTLVKIAYAVWFYTLWCFLWNIFTILSALIATGKSTHVASLILSIVFFIFFTALAFLVYRLLYGAAKKLKSSTYLIYMCLKWFEFIVYAWMGIGLTGWGGGGFLLMIGLFKDKDTVVGIFSLICTVFWGIAILLHLYLFIHTRIFYKRAGGFQAAKKQGAQFAAQTAAENPEFVASVAKGAKSAY